MSLEARGTVNLLLSGTVLYMSNMNSLRRLIEKNTAPIRRTNRAHSVAVPHAFLFPFFIHSVSILNLFPIYPVLFLFCQCSIGKCSWNSFKRTRFSRTRLQECFQGISNTQSPYVCVQEYKQ